MSKPYTFLKLFYHIFVLLFLFVIVLPSCFNEDLERKKFLTSYKEDNTNMNDCIQMPSFIKKYGLVEPIEINMDWQKINLIGAKKRKIHLDQWDQYGQLGNHCFDNKGNIYTHPRPFLNLFRNNPKDQNKILRIDEKSSEMTIFLNLDNSNLPKNNPFGVMDVKYDCNIQNLFISSIYGSDFKKERGIIYSVNKNSKKVIDKINNIDVLGIGIFIGIDGKRLFFGHARSPLLYSIRIDNNGYFIGKYRKELDLSEIDIGIQDNIIDIKFKKDKMYLEVLPFAYSMFAAIDPNRTIYEFIYNVKDNKWNFRKMVKKIR